MSTPSIVSSYEEVMREREDLFLELERVKSLCSSLEDRLIASRSNEASAREERDKAIVKIFKVAKMCEPCTRGEDCEDAVCVLARQVRAVLGVCPTCGLLGRIADHPCPTCSKSS